MTSFCDQQTACGTPCGNCNWAYSTSAGRFGCNSQLKCCQGSKCTTLKVIDSGPGCRIERAANMPIIDASYSTCKFFTGSTSCGYSDKIHVNCVKLADDVRVPDELLGPCATTRLQSKIEHIPMCP